MLDCIIASWDCGGATRNIVQVFKVTQQRLSILTPGISLTLTVPELINADVIQLPLAVVPLPCIVRRLSLVRIRLSCGQAALGLCLLEVST